jgi:hypothetical protein
MNESFDMKERKEPKFITFNDGDIVEGVLQAIQAIEMKDKQSGQLRKVTRFVLLEGDTVDGRFVPSGESVCFLGTYQLNTALLMSDRGHFVSVRCEGNDSTVTKSGNAMKRFRVWVSAQTVIGKKATDSLEITDDDIPF